MMSPNTGTGSEQRGLRPEPLQAAREYAARKRAAVEQRCADADIRFYPMVIEVTGGIETATALPTLHRIAEAVAEVEGGDLSKIKADLLQRLSLEVARSAARAVLRRSPPALADKGGASVNFLLGEGSLDEPAWQ
jgi:hypothetical protein